MIISGYDVKFKDSFQKLAVIVILFTYFLAWFYIVVCIGTVMEQSDRWGVPRHIQALGSMGLLVSMLSITLLMVWPLHAIKAAEKIE